VPLWTETACRFPAKPPAGLNRNRLSETPKFARYQLSLGDLAEMFLIRGLVFSYEAVRDWEAKLTLASIG
jgi:hypothetical protein